MVSEKVSAVFHYVFMFLKFAETLFCVSFETLFLYDSFLHCFGVFLDTIPAVFWDTILAPFWNILSACSQCFFGYVVPHVLDMFFGSQFSLLSHAFFDTLFDIFLHAFSGSNVFLQEFIF